MILKVRYEHDDDAIDIGHCPLNQVEDFIESIRRAGGFYVADAGGLLNSLAYQLVYTGDECYIEVVIYNDD